MTEPYTDTEPVLTLVVVPRSDDYEPTDPRWRSEVTTLTRALEQQVAVEQQATAAEGKKFGVIELVAVLGSAGAIRAAVQAFQAWLKRDRSRHLTLTWEIDGQPGRIDLDGEAASEEGTRQVLQAALDKLSRRGR